MGWGCKQIVYEVAVRGFTAHDSAHVGELAGSYLGLASKVHASTTFLFFFLLRTFEEKKPARTESMRRYANTGKIENIQRLFAPKKKTHQKKMRARNSHKILKDSADVAGALQCSKMLTLTESFQRSVRFFPASPIRLFLSLNPYL